MRIGFDAKRAFTNYTGLGNYSRFIIRILGAHFPENSYILYTPQLNRKKKVAAMDSPSFEVKTPGNLLTSLPLTGLWRSMFLGNRAINDRVALFHGLSNELPWIVNRKLKTVVTIHDLLFIRYPELYPAIDIEIYRRKFRHACDTADRIIAVSRQTSEDIQTFFGVHPDKITVVYQGCHPQFKKKYSPAELKKCREKYNLPLNFMLNVGTIEPRKNALLIVKALALLKNRLEVPLVLVGRPVKNYQKELMEAARKSGIVDQIMFLTDVPLEDLPKIYQLSRLFIYPSVFEGFGIPIIEALHSRVPVISSKGSCFSEAGGAGSRYVDPSDPEGLAEAIETVGNDPELCRQMIVRGEAHIQNFEDQKLATQLMGVYRHVVGT